MIIKNIQQPSEQFDPVYPSVHPSSHVPLMWLHGLLSLQCPTHLDLHSNPKYPAVHSTCKIWWTHSYSEIIIPSFLSIYVILFIV